MATKRIETQLTIKAVDQYSSMLRNMRTVTGRFADGVRTEMSRLQGMRGPLRLIDDFRKQQDVVRRSGVTLEAAREKQRRLLAEIRATRNPTAQMRREFERARGAADRLEQQHQQNRRALHGLQVKLRTAGVNTGDLAGEQRRLADALDGATSSFGRQVKRMGRLETMQTRIAEARGRMDRSLATAANISFVGQASVQSGRRIITALSDVSDRAGDLEDQFAEFQSLTEIDDTRLARLREELDGLRDVTKTSVSDMLDGLAVLAGKGMDFEDALAALPAAGRAAKATKTSFDEMGASGFALYDNLKVAPEELRKAFDIMAMGGKEGGFELSAMARKFPEITAGARALKMEGLDSVAQLTAALQIAMKSAGSEDQAATNLSNFLGKITSPETVRRFAKLGVSVEGELKKAAENGVSPFEHMLGVIDELTGGDALKMGELFGDKQVLDFLRATIPNLEEYRRIKDAALSADGVVDADLARLMGTFNESKAQLGESIGNLFSLPPEVLESLTDLFQKADSIVERMIVWKKENPKLVKTLFMGAAAFGAMAVAGGALLTAGAGLIGTMAVLRFGMSGLGARAVFAAGDIASLSGRFGLLRRLPRFRLASLVTPLRWVAELVPPIRWPALAGRLRWTSLIRPLSWLGRGALRFIPVIGWAALAGELLWRFLIKPLGWDEYLPSIDWHRVWGAFSWEGWLPEVDWSEFVSAIDWPDWVSDVDWARWLTFDWMAYINPISWVRFIPNIPWSDWFGFEWSDYLPDWSWSFIGEIDFAGLIKWPEPPDWLKWLMGTEDEGAPPVPTVMDAPGFGQLPADQRAAAETVSLVTQSGPLPTPVHLQELRDYAASLREEIAGIQGEIDNLGQGPMADSMAMPLRQTMDARRRELQEVEAELSASEAAADDLSAALRVIHGTEVAPEIGTASIERANELLAQMISRLRTVSAAGANVTATPKPAGARAGGGAVRMGLPYLVNENTPRSEWFVPSRSGGVLNVGQAQAAFRSHLSAMAPRPVGRNPELARLHRGAQGLRAASLAVLTSSALAAPAAVQPAQVAKPGSGAVTVQIENFTVHVPSGGSDPEAIADLVSDRIGQRVAATMSASFSD